MCFSAPELVILGVGYHHAGVELSDRKLIEKVFTQAELPVLCESVYSTILKLTHTFAPYRMCMRSGQHKDNEYMSVVLLVML